MAIISAGPPRCFVFHLHPPSVLYFQNSVSKDRSDYILQDLDARCITQTGVFGGQNTPKWVKFGQSRLFADFVFDPLLGAPHV